LPVFYYFNSVFSQESKYYFGILLKNSATLKEQKKFFNKKVSRETIVIEKQDTAARNYE